MRLFKCREIDEALAYAAAGGQALHVHRIIADYAKAPRCFTREVEAGRDIAHLFDQDFARLYRTAVALGVRVIVVERKGTPRQHIDLCGAPLRRAKSECDNSEPAEPSLFS